jgi:hypothetical protein
MSMYVSELPATVLTVDIKKLVYLKKPKRARFAVIEKARSIFR